jgi:hypothetical protein
LAPLSVEANLEQHLMAGKSYCSSFGSILKSFDLAITSFDEPCSSVDAV